MKQRTKMHGDFCKSLKRATPTILTCLSAVGMVLTIVTAVKATPKAMEFLKEATEEKGEELTKAEVLKAAVPAYIPTALLVVSTLSCMFGANILNRKQQASYISAYTLLDNSFRKYKDKVKEMYGDGADDEVKEQLIEAEHRGLDISPSDEKLVFYEDNYGEFFELTKEEVLMAENELNRTFILRGYVSLNDFYAYLGLPEKDFGEVLGWSQWAGEEIYGYQWIDFVHKKYTLDDGLEYYIISMPFPPTMDYEEY